MPTAEPDEAEELPVRCQWRDDRGIVASVIIMPVIVVALWLVLQAAFVMHARNVAQAAAQDAAIAAATGSDGGGVGASLFNQSIGGFANLSGVEVSPGEDTVTVTVRAQVLQVTPFSFSVAETATAPAEEFIPQSSRN